MKTLKHILEETEVAFENENPDDDTPYVELTLKAVKEWLNQFTDFDSMEEAVYVTAFIQKLEKELSLMEVSE